jgi:AcrR family transcriptional regulator
MSKAIMLDSAVRLASRIGYQNVTRRVLAQESGTANSTVSYHFGSMEKLRTSIIKRAIELGHCAVVAQGIAARDWHALRAPQILKDAAAKFIAA